MKRSEKKFRSIIPGSPNGVNVVAGDLSFALREFRRTVKESGILAEATSRTQYIKPTTMRRKQKLRAMYRNQKNRDAE